MRTQPFDSRPMAGEDVITESFIEVRITADTARDVPRVQGLLDDPHPEKFLAARTARAMGDCTAESARHTQHRDQFPVLILQGSDWIGADVVSLKSMLPEGAAGPVTSRTRRQVRRRR